MKRIILVMLSVMLFAFTFAEGTIPNEAEIPPEEVILQIGDGDEAEQSKVEYSLEEAPDIETEYIESVPMELTNYRLTDNVPLGFYIDGELIAETLSQGIQLSGNGWAWDGQETITLYRDFDEISYRTSIADASSLKMNATKPVKIRRLICDNITNEADVAVEYMDCANLYNYGSMVVGALSESELKKEYSGTGTQWAGNVYTYQGSHLAFGSLNEAWIIMEGDSEIRQYGEVYSFGITLQGGTYISYGPIVSDYYHQTGGTFACPQLEVKFDIYMDGGTLTILNENAGSSAITASTLFAGNGSKISIQDTNDFLNLECVHIYVGDIYQDKQYIRDAHTLIIEHDQIKSCDGWYGTNNPIEIENQIIEGYDLDHRDFEGTGWYWDHTTQSLILDNVNAKQWPSGQIVLRCPANIILVPGSVNTASIKAVRDVTITGSGALQGDIEGSATLIFDECGLYDGCINNNGDIVITNSRIYSEFGITSYFGDIRIKNSTIVAGGIGGNVMDIQGSVAVLLETSEDSKLTADDSVIILGNEAYRGRDIHTTSSVALFADVGKGYFDLQKNATLKQDFVVPEARLRVPKGKKLTIQSGATFYVTGELKKKGTIKGKYVIVKIPTALSITGKSSMPAGARQQLKLSVTPKDANPDVIWMSSDESVANINQDGIVEIAKNAEVGKKATILAVSTSGECYAEFEITVSIEAQSIDIFHGNEVINTLELWLDPSNSTTQIKAQVRPEIASQNVNWKSNSSKIASISTEGVIQAKKAGSTTIWAEATDGSGVVSPKITVKVMKAPSSVKVNKSISLSYDPISKEGTSANMNVRLSSGSASTLTFSGYDKNVVQIDENGTVTAIGPGKTEITVRTYNKKKATCKVTIENPYEPKGIKLAKTAKVNMGDTLQLIPELTPSTAIDTLKWSSDKTSVATVVDGLVTPHKKGTAKITVKTSNGKKAICKVTVENPYEPREIKLDKKGTITLKVGDTLQLNATLTPSTARDTVTWSSSKKSVATVKEGLVTAVKKGSATITVKTSNGKKAKIKIKVTK